MYHLKPIHDNIVISTSTTMYSVKSYYSDKSQDPALAELNKQHAAVSRSIAQLQKKADDLCVTLSLTHLISSKSTAAPQHGNNKTAAEQLKNVKRVSVKVNKNQIVQDFVIQCDPQQSLPYSIIFAIHQLSLKYKCFVQFFKTNSVSPSVASQNLSNLVASLKLSLKDDRSLYDYGFTFVWKSSLVTGPVLASDSLNHPNIHGESNILRSLNRLLNDNDKQPLNKLAIVDEWIDRCTNALLTTDKKKREQCLDQLNTHLSKARFLSEDSLTIADTYNWSVLVQKHSNDLTRFKNIIEWIKRLESANSMLQLLRSL